MTCPKSFHPVYCKIWQTTWSAGKLEQSTSHRTTLYYKTGTKYFPVLLCTTRLGQSTSWYYFVQQDFSKAFSHNTSYCKTSCTKYFPVLLCTTRLAQSTSPYYFGTTLYNKTWAKHSPIILRIARRVARSTSHEFLYYKTCAKHFPGLLCTARLARSISQYYFFVLQSLRKVLPSTTSYYKACKKHFSVQDWTVELLQKETFTQRSLCTVKLYTEKL